ncbi:MAG TPA: hypothetical protein VGD23_01140 [Sphingomicrobium sp.]
MVLAPPFLIYSLAHLRILLTTSGELRIASILIAIWSVGMAALLTSKWRVSVIIAVGIAYTLVSIFLLPMLTLSASCMVGPCL